jgi:hypothetical protein
VWVSANVFEEGSFILEKARKSGPVHCSEMTRLMELQHRLFLWRSFTRPIWLTLCWTFRHFFWRNSPQWARVSSFTRFLDHTKWRTTVGRTPLDEWSARRRDLYLTSYNAHNRQTSMPPVVLEPAISADKRPQTYALYCAATGAGFRNVTSRKYERSLMINVSEYLTVCDYQNYASWKQRFIWL